MRFLPQRNFVWRQGSPERPILGSQFENPVVAVLVERHVGWVEFGHFFSMASARKSGAVAGVVGIFGKGN